MVERALELAKNTRLLWGIIAGLLTVPTGLWLSGWRSRAALQAQLNLPAIVQSNTDLMIRNRVAIDSLRIARDSIVGQLKDIRCVVIAIARDENATLTCGLRGQ